MQEKGKQWALQEVQILMQMKDIEKPRKWKWISQYLSKRGWNRNHVECRNKWVNELAPGINHKAWTDCELKLLYSLYDQHNSHWSSIQKSLPGRTQIRIKNHFYGVLRGITRLILKYFKEAPGSQTKISNRINPNTLKNMYKGINQFSFLGNTIPALVLEMGYRFNKQKFVNYLEGNLENFKKLSNYILVIGSNPEAISGEDSIESGNNLSPPVRVTENQILREENLENWEKQVNQLLVPSSFDVPAAMNYQFSGVENPSCYGESVQFTLIPFIYEPHLTQEMYTNQSLIFIFQPQI